VSAARASGRTWRRLAVAGWEVVAGYLLAGAPLSPFVWNESFYAFAPSVQQALLLPAVRLGISSVGVGLLVFGAWDLAGLITGRSVER
jgi:hypothetical protein